MARKKTARKELKECTLLTKYTANRVHRFVSTYVPTLTLTVRFITIRVC